MNETEKIEEQMRIYRENRAAMKEAIARGDEKAEILHYQAGLRALIEARKLAGIGC